MGYPTLADSQLRVASAKPFLAVVSQSFTAMALMRRQRYAQQNGTNHMLRF